MMDDSTLCAKLLHLQWLMHRQRLRSFQCNPMADPTRGQGRILALLKLHDSISTRDLTYLLGIRVSSLNELLMKLEKGGYIRRVPSEEDRRITLVQLTEKGREKRQTIPKLSLFDDFTEEERADFSRYLDRLIKTLETMIQSADENDFEDDFDRPRPIGSYPMPYGYRRRPGPPLHEDDEWNG